MAACDGADRLQGEQCSLTARMSLVIPGQNTIDLARDSMDDTPWCVEWRIRRTLMSRRDGQVGPTPYQVNGPPKTQAQFSPRIPTKSDVGPNWACWLGGGGEGVRQHGHGTR